MNAEELASYQYQLDQVNTALQADPENAELNKLKQDLGDLITLTESFLQQQAQASQAPASQTKAAKKPGSSEKPATNPTPKPQKVSAFSIPLSDHQWTIGDTCQAKWSADKQYYEAVIVAIGGDGSYSVTFKGYGNTEVVSGNDIKPLNNKSQKKRDQGMEVFPEDPSSKKKKKTPSKTSETAVKQQAWLKFANNKKGKKSSAINKKSIFATPSEPEGKVGVVGSGKGMTDFQQRGKHMFETQ
ncbi:hypothetical protein K493DRAFT_317366 [Basidiobolus meristosporus CBS 931.73]|uniref:Survival of motor neuron-related-splicing factor 30 n=1 Tax=Basidiobolus meristosporus CBS 931.73 TaxID=1314790 RepID=A0A1Y1XZU8_9FUNG|nr:hypothetical protein K493DRAFT_317366 [Basidiobolus meristosporus CBS 931.73]|eukprot:ORX91290.1 hypothetical protein K493DRAFT_317366 [Basidiobolus meristosporus CBS 931.73]